MLLVSLMAAMVCAKSPKMKMTTPIPAEITTPDTVKTRLGTLRFKNGIADQETVKKIYDNLDFARAVNVYLDTLSGVSNWGQRQGQRDAGVPDNTLLTMEQMMDSTGMWLTPNTTTPQTGLYLSLKDGPMVLEVPPNVLGPVDDMWMRYVTDIGPLGPDKGKGGKYLFLPPGYEGKVPKSGYSIVKSPTFGLWARRCKFFSKHSNNKTHGSTRPGCQVRSSW